MSCNRMRLRSAGPVSDSPQTQNNAQSGPNVSNSAQTPISRENSANSTNSPSIDETVERPEPPPSPLKCSICLEELVNRCYSNSCLHQFCFPCLLEWSRVKAECPLCKSRFESIYHNIRSGNDYDEYIVPPSTPLIPHLSIRLTASNLFQGFELEGESEFNLESLGFSPPPSRHYSHTHYAHPHHSHHSHPPPPYPILPPRSSANGRPSHYPPNTASSRAVSRNRLLQSYTNQLISQQNQRHGGGGREFEERSTTDHSYSQNPRIGGSSGGGEREGGRNGSYIRILEVGPVSEPHVMDFVSRGGRQPLENPFFNDDELFGGGGGLDGGGIEVSSSEHPLRGYQHRKRIYDRSKYVHSFRTPHPAGTVFFPSPEYIRTHPSAFSKISPWLYREISVLLGLTRTRTEMGYVFDTIYEQLLRHDIRSREFRSALQPHFTSFTPHFQHEFYHFLISGMRMDEYDRVATYTNPPPPPSHSHSHSPAVWVGRGYGTRPGPCTTQTRPSDLSRSQQVITLDSSSDEDSWERSLNLSGRDLPTPPLAHSSYATTYPPPPPPPPPPPTTQCGGCTNYSTNCTNNNPSSSSSLAQTSSSCGPNESLTTRGEPFLNYIIDGLNANDNQEPSTSSSRQRVTDSNEIGLGTTKKEVVPPPPKAEEVGDEDDVEMLGVVPIVKPPPLAIITLSSDDEGEGGKDMPILVKERQQSTLSNWLLDFDKNSVESYENNGPSTSTHRLLSSPSLIPPPPPRPHRSSLSSFLHRKRLSHSKNPKVSPIREFTISSSSTSSEPETDLHSHHLTSTSSIFQPLPSSSSTSRLILEKTAQTANILNRKISHQSSKRMKKRMKQRRRSRSSRRRRSSSKKESRIKRKRRFMIVNEEEEEEDESGEEGGNNSSSSSSSSSGGGEERSKINSKYKESVCSSGSGRRKRVKKVKLRVLRDESPSDDAPFSSSSSTHERKRETKIEPETNCGLLSEDYLGIGFESQGPGPSSLLHRSEERESPVPQWLSSLSDTAGIDLSLGSNYNHLSLSSSLAPNLNSSCLAPCLNSNLAPPSISSSLSPNLSLSSSNLAESLNNTSNLGGNLLSNELSSVYNESSFYYPHYFTTHSQGLDLSSGEMSHFYSPPLAHEQRREMRGPLNEIIHSSPPPPPSDPSQYYY